MAKKIPLADATQAQLIDYARKVLQLDVKGRPSRENMIDMIERAGFGDSPVIMQDEPEALQQQSAPVLAEAPQASASEPEPGSEEWRNQRVDIMIALEAGMSRDTQVPVSHNGSVTYIQRGHRVSVPRKVAQVLKDSIQVQLITDEMGRVVEKAEIPAYPVTFYGEV